MHSTPDNCSLEELRQKRLAYFSNTKSEECDMPYHCDQKSSTNDATRDLPVNSLPSGSTDNKYPNDESSSGKGPEEFSTVDSFHGILNKTSKDVVNSKLYAQHLRTKNCPTNIMNNSEGPKTLLSKDYQVVTSDLNDLCDSVDIEELGLSTHRPEGNRQSAFPVQTTPMTLSETNSRLSHSSSREIQSTLEDTLGDLQLKDLLGEEKYQEFLDKSRKDIEALKLEKKASPGRGLRKVHVNSQDYTEVDGESSVAGTLSTSPGYRSNVYTTTENLSTRHKLQRPKETPALVSKSIVKSRQDLDSEAPRLYQMYGMQNYEETNAATNVSFSSNQIYHQAYPGNESHSNTYQQYGYLQNNRTSPQHGVGVILHSDMAYTANGPPLVYDHQALGQDQYTPPLSPLVHFSPHPPICHPPPQYQSQSTKNHIRHGIIPVQQQAMVSPSRDSSFFVYCPQPPQGGPENSSYRPTSIPAAPDHLISANESKHEPQTETYERLLQFNNVPQPPAVNKRSGTQSHKEHVEGIRYFHENRQQKSASKSHDSGHYEQYAVNRLEEYFSSVEEFYQQLKSGKSTDNKNMILSNDEPDMDDELETLVESTLSNLKSEGVSQRLRNLGIDVPFLTVESVKGDHNQFDSVLEHPLSESIVPQNPIEAKICSECGALNKSYMSWCATCGEVLIGVEVTILTSDEVDLKTADQKEGEDSGFDDKVSPAKNKGTELNSKTRQNKFCKMENNDSGRGRSSGEERETPHSGVRSEQEIQEICNSIQDPVVSGFLRSYLRKRGKNLSKKLHYKPFQNSINKTSSNDTFDSSVDNGQRKKNPSVTAFNKNTMKDSETVSSCNVAVSCNGHPIPLLDLGFSSDEDKPSDKKLDLSLSEDDEADEVSQMEEAGQGDAGLTQGNQSSAVSLEELPALKKSLSKPQSANGKKHRPGGTASSSVFADKFAPSPPRRWMRSSVAWSTYNPRELNKERSKPLKKKTSTKLKQNQTVNKNNSERSLFEERFTGDSPPPVQQQRPASANLQRRKVTVASRPESAGVRRTYWDGQRDINLKSRTQNMKRLTGEQNPSPVSDLPLENRKTSLSLDNLHEEMVAVPTPTKILPSPARTPLSNGFEMAQSAYNIYHSMTPRINDGTYSLWLCLPDELLLSIFSHLKLADLASCAQVCKHFSRVTMDQSLWRIIKLTKRQRLTDETLEVIGQHQPISLSFIQCHGNNITSSGLQKLFQNCGNYLEELNISRCSQGAFVGDFVLQQAAMYCKHITHLDVSWTYITNNGLSAISSTANRLEHVSLNGCQAVNNQGLETLIKKHGKSLRVMELFGCFNINQAGIRSIGHYCHNLLTLNLGQCHKVTDSTLIEVTGSLPRLESLDIRGCKQVHDSSIRRLVKNCPRLTSIALANCHHISDIAVSEIATYLTRIRWIDLCGCKNITDESLGALSKNCPNLYYIDISSTGCTRKSIQALATQSCDRLEVVKLNFLGDVDENCLMKLIRNRSRLFTLHLYGCKGLNSLVDKIKKERPNLHIEM